MTTTTQHDRRPWLVRVPKSNGARIVYGRYSDRSEAVTIAAALRAVGCAATVPRERKSWLAHS